MYWVPRRPSCLRRGRSDEVKVSERDERSVPRGRNAKRVAGAVGCLGAAAVAAANVASASFDGHHTVTPSVGAGTLYLQLGNGGVNRLTTAVSGLFPDNDDLSNLRERAVDVYNGGTLDYSSLSVTIAASGSDTTLATDTNGLQMYIDECPNAWAESAGTAPAEYTYTCGGNAQQNVIAGAPFNVVDSNGTSKTFTWTSNVTYTKGATNHLRFRFKLSQNAGNNLQGKSVTLTLTFSGTQRAAAYG